MDKVTKQFMVLNEVYRNIKKNIDTLKKMFNNHSTIKQKIILTEQMFNEIYLSIQNKYESNEINREFNKIIRNIKEK
jgi:hypothetical protein